MSPSADNVMVFEQKQYFFVTWPSFLQKKRYRICTRSSARVLKPPGNGVRPVMTVLAVSHQEGDWHPLNSTGVIQLFLFSSFLCFCQVLHTCQSFHALLVLICFLLVAALGQMSCPAQQLFRKGKLLKVVFFFHDHESQPYLGGSLFSYLLRSLSPHSSN